MQLYSQKLSVKIFENQLHLYMHFKDNILEKPYPSNVYKHRCIKDLRNFCFQKVMGFLKVLKISSVESFRLYSIIYVQFILTVITTELVYGLSADDISSHYFGINNSIFIPADFIQQRSLIAGE